MKKVGVIGSGFSSLTAACCLAKGGMDVHVYEKNESLGGRCSQFKAKGFTFDMGPSWYWMPEVFEDFFAVFGKKVEDYYELERLDPSYTVVFDDGEHVELPADYNELKAMFDRMEPGSSAKLDEFLSEAEYKYTVGLDEFVWKPGNSIMEFADLRVAKSMFKLGMLQSISSEIAKRFTNPKLIKILEFPVLFLGATPEKTPALYSLMNYADIKLGTWYPKGGMYKIIEGMVSLGKDLGVHFHVDSPIQSIEVNDRNNKVTGLTLASGEQVSVDVVVGGADYHHIEQKLLPASARVYDEAYWQKRVMAPSSLLFYIGIDRKVEGLHHHTLFFDKDFTKHAQEIYENPIWPTEPLFYMCSPSVTDASVAPEGYENIFFLLPIAPGLKDDYSKHDAYFDDMCERVAVTYGVDIRPHIVYKSAFCLDAFTERYNAFKGNAYGLANTLMQTAFLKPKIKSAKLNNLYYTGQLTSPGPGMPPSIISGQVVADMILKAKKA